LPLSGSGRIIGQHTIGETVVAKISKRIDHDWLAVRATFQDGQKADVTWSRGGERVKLVPDNPVKSAMLSSIVMESKGKMKQDGYPFGNLGLIADEIERVGLKAKTLDVYLTELTKALQVSGERPKPKLADSAPKTAQVTLKKSRGWQFNAIFPTGEKVDLKINQSSVGITLDPNLPSKCDEITNFVFGVKQAQLMTDDDLAAAIRDAAEGASDMDEWIAAMRAAVLPTRKP
jgi:hypothetical protein